MKSITFICQPYYPDTTATGQLITTLLESLSDRDVAITVLCGFPHADPRSYRDLPRTEFRHGIRIRRCGMRVNPKRSMMWRALSYLTFLSHVFLRLVAGKRQDIVIGITNPPFNAQFIWLAWFFRRFRYQYIIHDMTREALIGLKQLRKDSLIDRLWRFANGLAYRRAEYIIVLGRDVPPLLRENYGVSPDRCRYIPNWSPIEEHEIVPIESSRMYNNLGLRGKFVVQYSGNMGLLHDIEAIVRAAELLRDDTSIHFLIIGDGQRRAKAEALSRELQLTNVTWRDFVPLAELRDSLACCHLALISLRDEMKGVAVPSKLYGILASGRGILAQVPPDSEIALTVQENECGIVVPPGDAPGLAKRIREFATMRPQVLAMGNRAFDAYHRKYRLEHAVSAFRRLWKLNLSHEDNRSADAMDTSTLEAPT